MKLSVKYIFLQRLEMIVWLRFLASLPLAGTRQAFRLYGSRIFGFCHLYGPFLGGLRFLRNKIGRMCIVLKCIKVPTAKVESVAIFRDVQDLLFMYLLIKPVLSGTALPQPEETPDNLPRRLLS